MAFLVPIQERAATYGGFVTVGVSVDARLTFEEEGQEEKGEHQKLVFQAF
jgi:hypothetical protein